MEEILRFSAGKENTARYNLQPVDVCPLSKACCATQPEARQRG